MGEEVRRQKRVISGLDLMAWSLGIRGQECLVAFHGEV
jgi:hypothetical protein